MLNYYRILGVEPDVDISTIRRAFRVLAKHHHPDAGGDEELFKQIGIAFYVLSDPQSREEYDKLMHFREEEPNRRLREEIVPDYMAPYSGTMESALLNMRRGRDILVSLFARWISSILEACTDQLLIHFKEAWNENEDNAGRKEKLHTDTIAGYLSHIGFYCNGGGDRG